MVSVGTQGWLFCGHEHLVRRTFDASVRLTVALADHCEQITAVILGILSIASQQQQNSHPVVETPLVFGKSEMAQGTPAGKLQSGYGGYDPSKIGEGRGYADPSPPQKPTTASDSDDAELERLKMEMTRLQMEQQQEMQSKALADYETAMNSPLLFKNAPAARTRHCCSQRSNGRLLPFGRHRAVGALRWC